MSLMQIGGAISNQQQNLYNSLQNIGSNFLHMKGIRDTNQTNVDIQKQAQAYDYQKWQEMNKYNNPEQQMQRLRDAGLNPNLVYGSGTVSGNSTSSHPKPHTATVANAMANWQPNQSLNYMSQFQDLRVKEAQIDNIQASTKNQEIRTFNEGLKSPLLQKDASLRDYKLYYQQRLQPYLGHQFEADTNLKTMGVKGKVLENQMKELELELSKALKTYGIHSKDNPLFRLPALLLHRLQELFNQ